MDDIFKTRLNYLALVILLIGGGILLRLFQKQIIEHADYAAKAQNQYFTSRELPAKRGRILANDGHTPLAANIEKFEVWVVPFNLQNPAVAAEKLAGALNLDKKTLLEQINNKKLYIPPIARRLDEQQAQVVRDLKLSGVLVLPQSARFYPENELASQVLGFVDAEGQGRYGLEGFFNQRLRGLSGSVAAEKDTHGRWINIEEKTEPQDGEDVVLTIDRQIQYMLEEKIKSGVERFAADAGLGIIINPQTGDILAMAGYPTFDPNKFNEVPQDKQNVFLNPSVNLIFEPGSVLKPMIMAAAIDIGKVEPDTKGIFSNMVKVSDYEIHTALDRSFGEETMTQVLEHSDNVAMVWVAEQLGNEDMYKYLKKFGFGEKVNIELTGELSGQLPALKNWRDINRATMAFGQGIAMTPLQLIRAYTAIANKGVMVKPRLVKQVGEQEIALADSAGEQVIKEETAIKLREMLVSVVNFAYDRHAQVPGYRVAGKTGTAQIPKPEGGYYDDQAIHTFAGFAPADDPKFLALIRLDRVKNVNFAGDSSAVLFSEISQWLLEYLGVKPTQ